MNQNQKAMTKTEDNKPEKRQITPEQALARLLSARMKAFASVLPKHITPERLARLALDAAMRKPEIFDCTPASIIKSLMDCATMGLEPVGKGGVHLVPFKNKHDEQELTAIIDYRGAITLAYRAGFVKTVRPQTVHDGDQFDYISGDDERILHKPNLQIDRYREDSLSLVYAIVELKTGGKVRKVLNRAGIDRYRAKSRAKNGPWTDDYVSMALKTVILRALNEVPQSAEVQQLFERESAREFGYDEPTPIIIDVQPAEALDAQAILREARESAA